MSNKDSSQLKKAKKKFLAELKKNNGDKKLAAAALGISLVEVRSWRHKDPEFNREYKLHVVGSKQAKEKTSLKEPFIELLLEGLSQRQACEKLKISIVTLRTWKKTDADFKKACLKARFGE